MKTSLNLRLIAFGLLAGLLLSILRAPLGLDWTQVPASSGATQTLFRAAALIAVALFLRPNRSAFHARFSGAWLLFAILIGFSLHSIGPLDFVEPKGRISFGLTLILFTAGLGLCAGRRSKEERPEMRGLSELVALAPPVRWPEGAGLFAAGAGVAIALETLAHEVRLFGLGLPEDDSWHAIVVLLLSLFGALSFGPFLRRKQVERPAFAYGLPLVAASTVMGLWFLAGRDRDGLFKYLRRMDVFMEYGRKFDRAVPADLALQDIPTLDGTSIGTWWIMGILVAAAWILPAFALGTAIGGTRHPGRIANAILGAGFGVLMKPWLTQYLAKPLDFEELSTTPFAWSLVVAGTVLAAGGSAIAVAITEKGLAQKVAPVVTLLCTFLPWIQSRLTVWSFSPWYVADIQPDLALPTSEGLITVEKTRGSYPIVTLDRRRLTPSLSDVQLDTQRLQQSLALVKPPADRPLRVLLIGQITPDRSYYFRQAGVTLERTASWFKAFDSIEEVLFEGFEKPYGQKVPPTEARARIQSGHYELVVVPPTHGPVLFPKGVAWLPWASVEAPLLDALEVPEGTIGVAWVDAVSPLAERKLGDSVLVSMQRFDNLTIGAVFGREPNTYAPGHSLFKAPEPASSLRPLELLNMLPRKRIFELSKRTTNHIAEGNAGLPQESLARGIAHHFAVQEESSPYENRAQQLELSEDALRSFLKALPETGDLPIMMRGLWESVAWLLIEKRRPDLMQAYVEPLADRFTPWPSIDRAVAYAHREMLAPETALRFLDRASETVSLDVSLWLEAAAAARELGDDERQVGYLRKGLAIQRDRLDLELPLALCLMRMGDEEGRRLLEKLAERHPEHEEIPRYLAEGPPPGGPKPFLPGGGIGHDSHEH